jgi:hypothetical protein
MLASFALSSESEFTLLRLLQGLEPQITVPLQMEGMGGKHPKLFEEFGSKAL